MYSVILDTQHTAIKAASPMTPPITKKSASVGGSATHFASKYKKKCSGRTRLGGHKKFNNGKGKPHSNSGVQVGELKKT